MNRTLYYHPLSSYCWKVLIALYELEIAFEPRLVELGNPEERAAFLRLWPMGKFPVLHEGEAIIPESTMIIEHLDRGRAHLVPADEREAWRVRAADRFYDLHIHSHMQAIVGDRLRPADRRDPLGVERARVALLTALGVVEADMRARTWAVGDVFTMADCAAAPALYYANKVAPFATSHPTAFAYLERLQTRPSFKRVLVEAEPYSRMFPG
jgi:glutathione S-transferase